ncbi:MAG: hypothetical protein ACRC4L_01485 [Mycoplasma sp.]
MIKNIQTIYDSGMKLIDSSKVPKSKLDLYNYKNEDRYLIEDNYIVVIDGATPLVISENKLLDLHFFLDFCIDQFKALLPNKNIDLKSIINTVVKNYGELVGKDISPEEIPSATLAILRNVNNQWESLVIGDARIYIKIDDIVTKLATDDLDEADDEALSQLTKYSKDHKIPFILTLQTDYAKDIFKKNRILKNVENGYVSFDLNLDINKIETYKTHDKIDSAILCSDGFDELVSLWKNEYPIEKVFEYGLKKEFNKLSTILIDLQLKDIDCEQYKRFKVKDDTTAIYIETSK